MNTSPNRIPSLDGLRTLSIALVLIGHGFHVYGLGTTGNFGNLGVRIFFVISGFLITGLLVAEVERTGTISLLKFYFRRTLRIFPPFYFYLLVMAAGSAAGLVSIPSSSLFYASAYFTDYVHPVGWHLGHTWSLAVEEQFYLILPGLILLAGLSRMRLVLLAVVLVAPFVRVLDFHFSGPEQMWVLKGFHANADALAAGCLLCLYRGQLHASSLYRRIRSGPFLLILILMVFGLNLLSERPLLFLGPSLSLMNIAIALCIDWAVVNYDSLVGSVLNSRPAVYLGGMSYSIYLWQQPFLNPNNPSMATVIPFNLLGIAITSLISYYLIEKYSLELRRRLEIALFSKNAKETDVPRVHASVS